MRQRLNNYLAKHTALYRTREARMKYWWFRAAPITMSMGITIEYIKINRSADYRAYHTGFVPPGEEEENIIDVDQYKQYLETRGGIDIGNQTTIPLSDSQSDSNTQSNSDSTT